MRRICSVTAMEARKPSGFSLIELMIAVALIGILAAVAVPTYRGYRQEGFRAEAKTNLTNLAMLIEEYRSLHDTYCPPAARGGCNAAPGYRYEEDVNGNVTINEIDWLDFHPKQATASKAVRYNYRAQVFTQVLIPGGPPIPRYLVTAIPYPDRGAAAGDLTLDQDGAKTMDGYPGWEKQR